MRKTKGPGTAKPQPKRLFTTKDTKEKWLKHTEQTDLYPGSKSGALVGVYHEKLASKANSKLFPSRARELWLRLKDAKEEAA